MSFIALKYRFFLALQSSLDNKNKEKIIFEKHFLQISSFRFCLIWISFFFIQIIFELFELYHFICSSYSLNLICKVQYFYGHNYDWKKYIVNIFIENYNTMISLQFMKTKNKSKHRGNQFRKPMIFIVVFSLKRWMEIQEEKDA